MSHEATNWAFEQPERLGIKPNEWAVLMVLANCHNPVNGCYPSQDYICRKTGLSERSVRDQLDRLRERGLIDWQDVREAGRRGSNRYRLGCEKDFRPAKFAGSSDDASDDALPANSAGSQPANFDSSTGKSCTFYRQNLPLHKEEPVREPVIEPSREMRASDETGDEPSDAEAGEDPRAIERAFRRLTKSWPGFGGMPKDRAERAFAALSADERADAERKHPGWLALLKSQRKTHVPGPEAYFKGRLWQDVAEPQASVGPQVVLAKPFGPDWSAARMVWLLQGPKGPAPTLSPMDRRLVEQGKHTAEEFLAPKRRSTGWPDVNLMHERAESRQPVSVLASMTAPEKAMEAVPVGSAVYRAWESEHEARGWPWIPDPGALRVVWFPAGGPARLDAFVAVMPAAQGGSHAGA